MSHAVLAVCFGNVNLTRDAVKSVLAQDIGDLEVYLFDNGSTDGTEEYFESLRNLPGPHRIIVDGSPTNISPNIVANRMLKEIFERHDKVLMAANDVVLPPNMYRMMSQWRRGMVTASQTTDRNFPVLTQAHASSENTPFALIMLRKWVWDAVVSQDGFFFDERYHMYCSDCDLALRVASCGIRGIQLDLPYFHEGSATLKLASSEEHAKMCQRADEDRQKFIAKWGFSVSSLEYGQMAVDLNFKAEAK